MAQKTMKCIQKYILSFLKYLKNGNFTLRIAQIKNKYCMAVHYVYQA